MRALTVVAILIACELICGMPLNARHVETHSPQQIHISASGDPGSYVVQWVSFGRFDPSLLSVVEYGSAADQLSMKATAKPWEFVELRCNTSRTMHSVVVSNVKPESTLFYRIYLDGYVRSQVMQLQVPSADPLKGLTFSIFGDLGSRFEPNSINKLKQDTKAKVHDFIIHHGDIAYDLDDDCNYVGDEYMTAIQEITTSVPYMFGPGNHETDVEETYTTYLNRFKGQEVAGRKSGSGSSRYYSWDMPNVHFLMLDTDAWIYQKVMDEILQPMYEFARRDLASVNRTKTPWVIVIGHRSMYCSCEVYKECVVDTGYVRNGIPSQQGTRYGLETLLKDYGVDLYIAGHTHHYERTFPVLNEIALQKDYNNPKGPVHILIGRAGVDTVCRFPADVPSWVAFNDVNYTTGYGRMHIYNATHLDFVQLDGTFDNDVVVDSFSIVQQRHGPFHHT